MELKAELRFSAAPLGRFGGPSVLAGGASGAFWVRLDLRIVLMLWTFGKRNEMFNVDAQHYTANSIGHSQHCTETTRRQIHLPLTQGGVRPDTVWQQWVSNKVLWRWKATSLLSMRVRYEGVGPCGGWEATVLE